MRRDTPPTGGVSFVGGFCDCGGGGRGALLRAMTDSDDRSAGGARFAAVLLGLFALLCVVAVVSPFVGYHRISPSKAFDWSVPREENVDRLIFETIRLPRVLFGLVVGGALALAGAAFQALLRNDLATPYTLGISGGSAFGALMAMTLMGTGSPVGAVAGAGTALAAILVLASGTASMRRMETLLLAGITMNLLFGAGIQVLQWKANPYEISSMVRWMMGGLEVLSVDVPLLLLVPLAAAAAVLMANARFLNVATFGDMAAAGLGMDPRRRRLVVLGTAALLTALVVAWAGPVGFVGLIVPHAVRKLTGPDNVRVLPCSILAGASFLVFCDLLARLWSSEVQMPVGIVTACVGGPVFLAILYRKRGAAA